jgi:hypothetical protein
MLHFFHLNVLFIKNEQEACGSLSIQYNNSTGWVQMFLTALWPCCERIIWGDTSDYNCQSFKSMQTFAIAMICCQVNALKKKVTLLQKSGMCPVVSWNQMCEINAKGQKMEWIHLSCPVIVLQTMRQVVCLRGKLLLLHNVWTNGTNLTCAGFSVIQMSCTSKW